MVTRLEVSFENPEVIVITWFENFNWERLEFSQANTKAAKLKIIELTLKMG